METMGFVNESHFRLPEIQGVSSVNTGISRNMDGTPVLSVLNSVTGLPMKGGAEEWFEKAHGIQLGFFNGLFKKTLLDKWR